MSAKHQSITATRATKQVYIGEDSYEICRRLAFENRSTIREEADRLIAIGVAHETKKVKKG